MRQADYTMIRPALSPGDLIAFGGNGFVSNLIKVATNCAVSHVGVVLQTVIPVVRDKYKKVMIEVIESTSLGKGFAGVQTCRLSARLKQYDGNVWVLPLKPASRKKFDANKFFNFMLDQIGKAYDAPQAISSAIDFLPDRQEDFSRLFCSELVTAGYEIAGVIEPINASEQTPADVVRMPIFDQPIQIKGEYAQLFN